MAGFAKIKIFLVYRLRNKASGKIYIGKTGGHGTARSVSRRRFAEHIGDASGASKFLLHNAIRKYGHVNFDLRVLEVYADETIALAAEVRLIRKHRSYIHDAGSHGYNMTRGGEGISGAIYSAEARAKISAALKGKKLSPEQRKRMDAGRIGKPLAEERKAKIGAANRGKKRTPEQLERLRRAMTGLKRSPEALVNIRRANVSRPHTEETKAVMRALKIGKPLSAAHRAALSAVGKGRKQSPEHIARRFAKIRAKIAARNTQ